METSWQIVFDDALRRASVIAVRTLACGMLAKIRKQVAVAEHLGRVPTRP